MDTDSRLEPLLKSDVDFAEWLGSVDVWRVRQERHPRMSPVEKELLARVRTDQVRAALVPLTMNDKRKATS